MSLITVGVVHSAIKNILRLYQCVEGETHEPETFSYLASHFAREQYTGVQKKRKEFAPKTFWGKAMKNIQF